MSLKLNGISNTFASNLTKQINTASKNKANVSGTVDRAKATDTAHRSSQEYLSNLRQRFSNMNICVSDFKSKNQELNYMKGCSGLNNIAISSKILERMANDPATAEKYEKVIENVPNVLNEVKGKIESDPDCTLLAAGAMIEEDGNVSYWTYTCGTTTTEVNTGKEKMQARLEKSREAKNEQKMAEAKRKEKADAEKALEEKRAEKAKAEGGNETTFKITVTGTDIKSITQQVISKMSSISAGGSDLSSVDVLV